MRLVIYSLICCMAVFVQGLKAQTNNPGIYCVGSAGTGNCNQPGPSNSQNNFINDFINDFSTCGGNNDITNNNSGCCALPSNYIYYAGTHTLIVAPGQFITCRLRSGIIFNQGFAIFIDWNQNGIFDVPSERIAATNIAPPANTWVTLTFTIPNGQPVGKYRMRVRSIFAQAGTTILPCGQQSYSETEDYDVEVVSNNTSGVVSATLTSNSPVCSGSTLSITAITSPTTSVASWSGPNAFTSSAVNPQIFNATPALNGVYTVTLGAGLCPYVGTVGVTVAPAANFNITQGPQTICQGGNITGAINLVNNPNLFNFLWTSTSTYSGTIQSPHLQNTLLQPAMLPANVPVATVVYSITVSPTLNPACAITQTVGVTIVNPLTPSLTMPPPLCDISAPVQLTATPGGGTWSAHPGLTAGGVFSPTFATIGQNSVMYSVMVGTCVVSNTATLDVTRYYSPALSSSISMCVRDPQFNLMNIVQNTLTGVWSGIQVNNNLFNPSGLATGNYSLTYSTDSAPIGGVCPASTILVVPVFNPPVPDINPIGPLCSNAPTVALSASPPNGFWSGNPGVSSAGVRTPSLNLVGANSVTYSAGQGTCVASSSRTFHMSYFNTAQLTGSIPELCGNSNPVNLMSIVQNTNGSWMGTNTSTNVFSPAGLATGVYTFSYITHSTPNYTMCPDIRTLSISVLNPPVPVITQVGPQCSQGGTIQLAVTPATGTWMATPYLTSGGRFTPSLSPLGSNLVQYVIGTSTCNSSQISRISVEAFVPATITGHLNDQCTTNLAVDLAPYTLNNLGYWTGNGISGLKFDPAVAGSGNHILTYHTASSPSGLCPDQANVSVQVYSLAVPAITSAGPFCNASAPEQLKVSPVGGLFGGSKEGAVSPGGVFNPALALIGDNYINYTISVGPCQAQAQTKIVVEKFVSAKFSRLPEAFYCKNHEPFNLEAMVENPGGKWSGGSALVGTMFYPALADADSENEIVYETNSPSSLCPDKSSAKFHVKNLPVVSAASSRYKGCPPLEVVLNTPNTNSGYGVWNITDGASYTTLVATHVFKQPGTYSVVFTYQDNDAQGCTTQVILPVPIVVYEQPKADFAVSPYEITIADPQVSLTNLSTNLHDNRYLWEVQGQEPSQEVNPKFSFSKPGTYRITLTASSLDNCQDVASRMIEVKNDFRVNIPNSFTPNYDDINDVFIPVFTPYGLDTKSFEMEVFDRWGHLLYRTTDLSKGWDGTVKGENAKEDIYVYRIRYKDLDGQAYSKNGHVSLLR